MTRAQAKDFRDRIAALGGTYLGSIFKIHSPRTPGYPYGVDVIHTPSQRIVSFAATPEEADYVLRSLGPR